MLKSILKIGWRNIFRNRRRTMITVAAITLNTAVLIMTLSLIRGTLKQMLGNITQMTVGQAQIHAPGYRDDPSMYKAIENPAGILQQAREAGIPAAARSFGFGLVAAGTKSGGGQFWGVDPAAERIAFELPAQVDSGSYLGPTAQGTVVIGKQLAKTLQVEVGSEITAMVQAANGSIGAELFKVQGIFKGVGDAVDRSALMLHAADFERLFLAEGRVHQIALNSRDTVETGAIADVLGELPTGAVLEEWTQIMPQFSKMVQAMDAGLAMFMAIFLLAAFLGVLNTMMMAMHERIREFGLLKAIGAGRMRIIGEMTAEAWMLAVLSTAVGTVLGLVGAYYLQQVGIDLSGSIDDMTVGGVVYNNVWKGDIQAQDIVTTVLSMWTVSLGAALYPALKAAFLKPLDAIHHV